MDTLDSLSSRVLTLGRRQVLMSELPSPEADAPVTRQFLRAELAEMEQRMTVRLTAVIATATAILGTLTSVL